MSANLVFWTGALVNLAVIAVLAATGVTQIRRGDVARHRRSMLGAGALVVAFLVSYVLKVELLGREDRSLWSSNSLYTLYFHESCVMLMLLAGAVALSRAWRLRNTRLVTRNPEDPRPAPSVVSLHRRSGWVAVVGAIAGFLSAIGVLYGMYARL